MKRENEKYCPISNATKVIGDFWSILIIRQLLKSEKRFSDLEHEIEGITGSTLSTKLKNLEKEQIIIRTQYQCIPPKVIYSLTEKGIALQKVVQEIEKYGRAWYSLD